MGKGITLPRATTARGPNSKVAKRVPRTFLRIALTALSIATLLLAIVALIARTQPITNFPSLVLAVGSPYTWLAAVAAPMAMAVVWGLLIAPNATNPIALWLRELLGSALLLLAAGALALAGRPGLAAGFAALVDVNTVLLFVLRDETGLGWARLGSPMDCTGSATTSWPATWSPTTAGSR